MRSYLGRSAALFTVLSIFCLPACSGPGEVDDDSASEDAITDVPNTSVKEQTIGNCWVYASVAWAEALHQTVANESLDLSESYISYWHWYEQLATIRDGAEPATVQTGGFFHEAVDLMNSYGLMLEGKFIANDEGRAASTRQKEALARVNDALKAPDPRSSNPFLGRLAKASLRTPKNIRAVLDDAFDLAREVRADLDATFGTDEPRKLTRGRAVPVRIIPPWSFEVASKTPTSVVTKKTLDVVSGEWEEVSVYGQSRGAVRRLQKTLHDSLPALIVWNVDHASSANDGSYRRRPTSKLDKWDGAHMTVAEDYQAAHVPNYGTLPAGTTISDPQALASALSDQTEVSFLRIKNSWGFRPAPAGSEELKGYYDLWDDYLFGMRALSTVIVPRAYDSSAPAGVSDSCATGGRKRTGTYCVKGLTGDASDKRLVVCQDGVSSSGRVCEQGCAEQAAGTPDSCVDSGGAPAPPPPNPCKTGGARSAGKYCGASLRLPSSDPGFARLYSCQKDPVTSEWLSPSVPCPRGCKVQPSGVPDTCK